MKTAIYKVAYNLGGSTNYTYIHRSTERLQKRKEAY